MHNIITNNSLSFPLNIANYPNSFENQIYSDYELKSNNDQPEEIWENKFTPEDLYEEDKSNKNDNYILKEKEDLNDNNKNNTFITNNNNKIHMPISNINSIQYEIGFYSQEKNKKIFEILKKNKKVGRIKKNSMIKGKHNRLSEDNIIRKIKARFLEKLRLYINREYRKYTLKKNKKKKIINNWLKRVNPKISRNIKKEDNLSWFQSSIKDIFSENVSLRYSSYLPDSNKKKIDRLLLVNEAKQLIDILGTKVETMFDKYVNNEKIEEFKTIDDDINELKNQMKNSKEDNIDEYLKKYKYVAKNMKQIFILKNPRNYNKNES